MTTPVTVLPMRGEHIDALMPFERDMFGTEAWSAAAYRQEIGDTANRYYLAAESGDGALLGWAGVLIVGDAAEILTVGVVPEARRRGVARALIAGLLQHARERGTSEAFLEVRVDNAAARALYASEGFAEIGIRRGYYDAGRVDAVVMRRGL